MAGRLQDALRDRRPQYGLWVTLESPSISEIAAELACDWICVDMEHGHLGFREVLEHTRAVRGSATAVLVRVPDFTKDAVQRALDLGVDAILLPLIRTAADVEAAMRYALYPPEGARGIGGERAVRWGLRFRDYLRRANDDVLVIPLVETKEAAENVDAILAVRRLPAIFFGPADLSASLGHLGEWEGAGVGDRILAIKDAAAARRIAAGIVGTSFDDVRHRRDQGFLMIGLGSDVGLLIREARGMLEGLRSEPVRHQGL